MRTIVGIFAARDAVSRAVDRLREMRIAPERINILLPGGIELGHTAR